MKILFICTQNRCRSIIAEAVANHFGRGRVIAASAGSEPVGEVHPDSLRVLQAHGVPTTGLTSKSWDDMESFEPDFVIMLCDRVAKESCPLWFGMSLRTHWGLKDPAGASGSDAQIWAAFENTFRILKTRIEQIENLLESSPSRTDVYKLLEELGSES